MKDIKKERLNQIVEDFFKEHGHIVTKESIKTWPEDTTIPTYRNKGITFLARKEDIIYGQTNIGFVSIEYLKTVEEEIEEGNLKYITIEQIDELNKISQEEIGEDIFIKP